MNLTSLRYLVALSEHRHFARAADACHITQPALSNALRALEKELGIALVKRGRAFAGLTDEGLRVLQTARRMLREQELLQQDLRGSAENPQGCLRVGTVPTAVPIATRFLSALKARHPGIVAQLRSLSSQDIEAGLQDQTLDLGLGFTERLAGQEARFESLPQYEECYFLLRRRPALGSLQVGAACHWAQAAAQPLCLLSPEMHHRRIVDGAFATAGVEVTCAMETDSVLALVLAVVDGAMAAIVPGAIVASAPGGIGLEALPLTQPAITTPVAFMTLARAAPSHTLHAALRLAADADWLREAQAHAGALASFTR